MIMVNRYGAMANPIVVDDAMKEFLTSLIQTSMAACNHPICQEMSKLTPSTLTICVCVCNAV